MTRAGNETFMAAQNSPASTERQNSKQDRDESHQDARTVHGSGIVVDCRTALSVSQRAVLVTATSHAIRIPLHRQVDIQR